MSKNNGAWLRLFESHRIAENVHQNGSFVITADQIKKVREPRLMTKFDYRSQLPDIFRRNNLSILPISRGSYVISDFQTFHNFDENEPEVIKVDFPGFIQSIDYKNINSESTALNCAYVCGIIEHFLEDDGIRPTVSGRMSSLDFNFNIRTSKSNLSVTVKNSQIEIDGGFEGINSLGLIEAKNSISQDFLVRQIYYPYRRWVNEIRKPVRNIFLTYTNGIFHFREYEFADQNHYNSLRLVRQKKYAIREEGLNTETIQKVLHEVKIQKEPEVPFPQADSFERVINLCELLNENKILSSENITDNYDFDKRQTDYYTNAGRYLGLIDRVRHHGETCYVLTAEGVQLFKVSLTERQLLFAKLILSHKAFNYSLRLYFKKAEKPSKHEIVEIMKGSDLYKVSTEVTFYRRSSTVLSWITWIINLVEE